MFIGHLGVALAAKKLAPKTSLGTTFAAAQFVDLLWPALILTGVEHVSIVPGITKMTPLDFYDYPVSHSLLMALVWGVAFAAVYWIARRYTRGAWVIGALVVSHWLLDALVHRPDLPIAPWRSPSVGLGLWNRPGAEAIVEASIFVGGLVVYVTFTKAIDRVGRMAIWILAAFLLCIWIANVFGPPPPSVKAIGVAGIIGGILFIPLAAWIDGHRCEKSSEAARAPLFTEKHVGI